MKYVFVALALTPAIVGAAASVALMHLGRLGLATLAVNFITVLCWSFFAGVIWAQDRKR